MTKVWCASIECEHNKKNTCRAKEINLAVGRVHTTHNGVVDAWKCRTFEMSQIAKEMEEVVRALING